MAVPLIVSDKVVGVLDMQARQPGTLDEEVLVAFEALAGQLAVAIQNANLLAEAQQIRAEVEAQARRLARSGWGEYMDAIHKPELIGFVFDRKQIVKLDEADGYQIPTDEFAVSAPITVTGEALGSLVVEIGDETKSEKTSELVNSVARQVAQQIENLRLLDSAERYRYEAEQAASRQTIEGWQRYVENRSGENLGYLYDLNEVHPIQESDTAIQESVTLPLKARNEIVGKFAIEGLKSDDKDALELANAVAERLGMHIESLRLLEDTRRGQIELDKRARELAAVAEISTLSAKELDADKMLETVAHLTQRQFSLYHAHIFIYDENKALLKIAACGWKEGDVHEGTHGTAQIPITQEQSLVARAARTRQAVIVNDVHNEPGWLPNPLLPDTASELAVPLVVGDQLLGVLDVQKDYINAFTEEDASIQTTLASQVATALQNARSFFKAQQQAERESMLNTINQKIQSATSVEAVLQIAARELGHALGAPLTIAQLGMKDRGNGIKHLQPDLEG
jgi:GAF domain-containing protein